MCRVRVSHADAPRAYLATLPARRPLVDAAPPSVLPHPSVRLLTTPRALHALVRLASTAAVGAMLVVGDAMLASPVAASPAAAATVAATSTATPRRTASRDARTKRARRSSARSATKATTRASSKRSSHRRASRSGDRVAVAPPKATVLPPVPAFALPDLAALFPGDSSVLTTATAVANAPAEQRTGPFAAFSRSATSLLDKMVTRARGQLGTRYVLGATEPGEGLDCSSFARYAMEAIGIKLPRTAAQQARVGSAVPRDRGALRPGDLLTFGSRRTVSHVGIYLGEGRFIHASVKSGRVIETTFDRNSTLLSRWTGARRLIASGDSATERGG